MTDPRHTDPRYDDPRYDDPPPAAAGPRSNAAMWGWIAGIAVVVLIAFLLAAGWNDNVRTAGNTPPPATTGAAPTTQAVPPPSTTGSGVSAPTMKPPATTPPTSSPAPAGQ